MANPLKMLKIKSGGFQFIQEIPTKAAPREVWSAVLNVGKWFGFDPDRSTWSRGTLEPWAGGRWISESPNGTNVLMAFVALIEPQKLLRLIGPLGMSHLPVTNVFIFELQPKNGGKATLLRFGQRTVGLIDADLKKRYQGAWKKLLPNIRDLAENR